MAGTVTCARCKQKLPGLDRAPFGGPLGRRVEAEICQACWKAWLTAQTQLINHYGLSTINPDHQQMLIENLQSFLFGIGQGAQIDTSLEGKISH